MADIRRFEVGRVVASDAPAISTSLRAPAKQSILSLRGEMDCFASLAMTAKYCFAFSRRDAPGVLQENLALETEGAGKTGGALHPRSRVRFASKSLHTSIQVQRKPSGLPHAMALRLIRDRPGDRLSCHHHLQRLSLPHDLTPAPGRQAHTTSPPAFATLVSRSLRVHRIPPHGRDDRDRPSCRGRRAGLKS